MKFLLAAVNAKYIHSNLGIYSLKACADARMAGGPVEIELAEYTINHQPEQVLQDIYRRRPEAVGFSCYIWNISFVRELIADLAWCCPKRRFGWAARRFPLNAKRCCIPCPRFGA